MPARIKVDEDLPNEVAELLRDAGCDASSVVEERLTGTPDRDLWLVVQEEGRLLVTADKGFADVRTHPSGSHHGVVLFRLPRESRAGYIAMTRLLLGNVNLDSLGGAIVVVTSNAIRTYRSAPENG